MSSGFGGVRTERRHVHEHDPARAAEDVPVSLGRVRVVVEIESLTPRFDRQADHAMSGVGIDPVGRRIVRRVERRRSDHAEQQRGRAEPHAAHRATCDAPSISAPPAAAPETRCGPGADSSEMSPSWRCSSRRTMSRPSPVPSPTPFVVKKGSKMRPWISGGTPGPSSMMRTTTRSRSRLGAHGDVTALAHGVERVVEQVHPDLVQLRAHRVHARHVVRRSRPRP